MVQGPGGPIHRVFLHGVRAGRGASRLLGRLGNAFRRSPEVFVRPRSSARGGRAPVSPGIFPAVPEPRRLPAGVISRKRLVQYAGDSLPRRERRAAVRFRGNGKRESPGMDLGGEGRKELTLPAGHKHRGKPDSPAADHRVSLWRRTGDEDPAGDPPGDRRDQGASRAGDHRASACT